VLTPAAALVVCGLLKPYLEPNYEAPFIAAVATVAWLCGTPYAIASTFVSLFALHLLFPPPSPVDPATAKGLTKILLFVGANGVIIGLIQRLFRSWAQLAAAEQRHKNLSELIPFGGWVADASGNITDVSASFLNAFATTVDECRGLGWLALVEEGEREQVRAEWLQCMRSGYFWDYEYTMRAPHGIRYVVLSRGVPLRDAKGRTRSWVGIHLDITALKHAAEERVHQARDIARFNAELEQLAYVSAHDLQEPLRMIASYLQLLARRYKGQMGSEADLFIDYAVDGANRLKALLQDLLLLQQVGKSTRNSVACNLSETAAKALEHIGTLATETNATVVLDNLPVVQGDEPELIQLFENLFDNAIKYRQPDTAPRIRVSAERSDSEWIIGVNDNGIGIDSEYLDRIFHVFQRLHARTEYPGTGIGLAICKKIVEVHGGRIWAESSGSEGTTFRFTLPVR
jgi:two-component system, chemotaxis family, sensor kinase Cph1